MSGLRLLKERKQARDDRRQAKKMEQSIERQAKRKEEWRKRLASIRKVQS
jgi:hypothetical protein